MNILMIRLHNKVGNPSARLCSATIYDSPVVLFLTLSILSNVSRFYLLISRNSGAVATEVGR